MDLIKETIGSENHFCLAKYKILCLIFIFSTIRCSTPKNGPKHFEMKEGIFVEKFDFINIYNSDNKVYTPNRKFYFKYTYKNKFGDSYFYRNLSQENENWDFTKSTDSMSPSIKYFQMEVKNGIEPMHHINPNYYQTVIEYRYSQSLTFENKGEHTGVIENEKNIWIHPPRGSLFQILELNPFPFIQSPFKTGNNWTWDLSISEIWGDKRWKEWKGRIANKFFYKIVGQKMIETPMGAIECIIVDSHSESSLGKTALKSFFNHRYGFVRLEYLNIDTSKIVIDLIKVE